MESYQSRKNSAAFQIKLEKFQSDNKKTFILLFENVKTWAIAIVLKRLKFRFWKEISWTTKKGIARYKLEIVIQQQQNY